MTLGMTNSIFFRRCINLASGMSNSIFFRRRINLTSGMSYGILFCDFTVCCKTGHCHHKDQEQAQSQNYYFFHKFASLTSIV